MHNDLKPTKFLVIAIVISSILIALIGLTAIFYGTGYEKLIATCLAIPIFSVYTLRGNVNLVKAYGINDLHWIFWWIFASIAWEIGFKLPALMFFLLTVIIFKRQKNFINDRVGTHQAI